MGRYSTADFGYDFPAKAEETKSLVVPAAINEDHGGNAKNGAVANFVGKPEQSEDGAGYELYDDHQRRKQEQKQAYRYQPAKINRGGENFFADSKESTGVTINPVECIGAFCCCITVTFIIFGGILVLFVKYRDSDPLLLVGSVLLVIAAGSCLCGCTAICIGTTADDLIDAKGTNGSKADPHFHEVQVRFRRLNDRFQKGCMNAEDGLLDVRLDVVGHMKEVRESKMEA